jgi:hypothetical protein
VVNSNSVTATFGFQGEAPEWVGVVVLTNSPSDSMQPMFDKWHKQVEAARAKWLAELETNRQAKFKMPPGPSVNDYNSLAQWTHFTTNLLVNLGPGDGRRELWIGFRYKGQTNCHFWSGHNVTVRTTTPDIFITNPRQTIQSQPMIQLQGYCPVPLMSISYDVLDQSGHPTVSNQEGSVNDHDYNPKLAEFTTSHFTCYDIDLTPGTNTIVFRSEDDAGNLVRTNFIFVFSTAGVVTGPKLTLESPANNDTISGSAFTLRGESDDPTADIIALITNPSGETSQRTAEVERTGRYWVENIPLSTGRTYVTLIANNAAGFSTITNLSVRKSRYELAMNPVVPASKLWQPRLTLTGSSTFNPSNYTIWVNGIQATMDTNGHWRAENVPTSPGGVAIFDMKAESKNGHGESDEPDPRPTVPIVWGNATNGVKWGVYLAPGNTNHLNRQHCDFYLLNDSVTNMNFHWMRPKAGALCNLTLRDSHDKAVPKSYWGKATGLPLASGLNLHRLGSNALEHVDGILPLMTNSPVHVSAVNLMDLFSDFPPGNYRLESTGRLYQIAGDGSLVPTELPVVSVPVTVAWQPSELAFHLRRLQAKGEFAWGCNTNGLQAGVAHDFEPQEVGKGDVIEVYLMNTTTNDLRDLILPAPDQQFTISLCDASGNEVRRTALGAQQGKPLSPASDPVELRPIGLKAGDVSQCTRFNLNAYFEIKSSGQYRLSYQQRLYQVEPKGTLDGVILPEIELSVEIQ